jgi:4,5-dihydroxyphthalate decarboxylase
MDIFAHGGDALSGIEGLDMITAAPVVLHSLLGNHPNTRAMKSGTASSPLVKFDYFEVKVANTQFKAMVRDLKYDFGELAIVTFLQAKHYGKPYVLLPATIVGRNQHHTIFYNTDKGRLTLRDLNGRRIGVRAYTQTTGTWVRGFLAQDYGVDLNSITWITFEEPHVAEYRDPPNVRRAPEGKALKQMLLDGEVDAAILGDVAEEGAIRHLIPDHDAAGRAWAAKHGGVPINHLAVMRESIVRSRPDVVREVYRVLKESRAAASLPTGAEDPLRFGIAAIRQSLEQINAYAVEQKLIPRAFSADELFEESGRILGAAGVR